MIDLNVDIENDSWQNDPGSRKVKNDEFSQEILNKGNQLFFPSLI